MHSGRHFCIKLLFFFFKFVLCNISIFQVDENQMILNHSVFNESNEQASCSHSSFNFSKKLFNDVLINCSSSVGLDNMHSYFTVGSFVSQNQTVHSLTWEV